MGQRVFALSDGDHLAERTIDAIENFYHQLGVKTQLTEHQTSKSEAVECILTQLEVHGMTALGEHQAITLNESRIILNGALA